MSQERFQFAELEDEFRRDGSPIYHVVDTRSFAHYMVVARPDASNDIVVELASHTPRHGFWPAMPSDAKAVSSALRRVVYGRAV